MATCSLGSSDIGLAGGKLRRISCDTVFTIQVYSYEELLLNCSPLQIIIINHAVYQRSALR